MKKVGLEIFVTLLAVVAGCSSKSSPNDDGMLTNLEISQGALSPVFASLQTAYTASELFYVETVTLTPTAGSPNATIMVDGRPVLSGTASQALTLSTGANPITVEVTTPNGNVKHYDVIVTRGSSMDYFKADIPVEGAGFGASVCLSGDTIAIGAVNQDLNGAVYVFTRSGSTWTQQAYLTPANADPIVVGLYPDSFGNAVSLSGDTLAVGASAEDSGATGVNGDQRDNSAPESGAVYVFKRSGSNWTQEAYLKASNPDPGDYFGNTVSLSGDTLAVGAYLEDSKATGVDGDQGNDFKNGQDSGAAYVFKRSAGTWEQQAYLKPSDLSPGDYFGISVSLADDTLAVGSIGEDSDSEQVDNRNAQGSGAVYVFKFSGETWTQQARLKASHPGVLDLFGVTVSLSGDTLAVGANHEDSGATGGGGGQAGDHVQDSGAVYVFTRSGETWTQQAFLKASNPGVGDFFGDAISLSGDTLAVGADLEDSIADGLGGHQADESAPDSGAVYLFTRSGSTWTQRSYIKASNTGAGDIFGSAVSVFGDTLAVGASKESSSAGGVNGAEDNDSAPSSGAVYLYE